MTEDQIYVKSHVARDLLQSAALFKTDKLVIWEYVANGLQYVDPGTKPVVEVTLDNRKKRIVVGDNGRGMDWEGLKNFFIMHGENLDRKEGQPGRGRFGTGKSAAFGIALVLRVTTIRNGRRSKVELTRADIARMGSEEPIPVRVIEREVPTDEPNGTTVEIEDVQLKSMDQAGIIEFVERHLARWPKSTTVFVNNHECEFREPAVVRTERFSPEGAFETILGKVELVIKVSAAPLPEDLRGVSIFSNGVWYETTLAGSEGRDMSQYLFGEIDVAKLDEDRSPIAAVDQSRSMQLNRNNQLVATIYAFIGQKVDQVRRKLVSEEKRRRESEEARKLSRQADEIAQVINADFVAFRQNLIRTTAKKKGFVDDYQDQLQNYADNGLVFGTDVEADIVSETGGPGATGAGPSSGNPEPRNLNPQVTPGGDKKQGQTAGTRSNTRDSRGGFQVEFKHMSADEFRAKYIRDERTIYVNLDHPQLVVARGQGGIEDPLFRRLSYEIAFSEYAIALAQELVPAGYFLDLSDPAQHIRETLNRIARKGAELFSS